MASARLTRGLSKLRLLSHRPLSHKMSRFQNTYEVSQGIGLSDTRLLSDLALITRGLSWLRPVSHEVFRSFGPYHTRSLKASAHQTRGLWELWPLSHEVSHDFGPSHLGSLEASINFKTRYIKALTHLTWSLTLGLSLIENSSCDREVMLKGNGAEMSNSCALSFLNHCIPDCFARCDTPSSLYWHNHNWKTGHNVKARAYLRTCSKIRSRFVLICITEYAQFMYVGNMERCEQDFQYRGPVTVL